MQSMIKDYFNKFIATINKIIETLPFTLTDLVIVCFILIVFMFFIFLINNYLLRSKIKKHNTEQKILHDILSSVNESTINKKLTSILSIIVKFIEAGSYSFYIYSSKHNEFLLKSVIYQGEEENVAGPSYSGLLPFKKGSFNPPASFSVDFIGKKVGEIHQGSVSLFSIPIIGGKGIIIAAPFKHIPHSKMKYLKYFSEVLSSTLDVILELESFKMQVESIVSSSQAVNCVSNMMLDHKGMVSSLMSISVKTLEANGGFFIEATRGNIQIDYMSGFDEHFEALFKSDTQTHTELAKLLDKNETFFISKSMPEFYKLPPYFSTQSLEGLLLVGIKAQNSSAIAGYTFQENSDNSNISNYRISAILMLSKRMGDILNTQVSLTQVSDSYLDILKMLSIMIDNLTPYTVGYSELMAHYSAIIADEMNLSAKDKKEICIAAFLSNLGVLALSNQLMSKTERYSEVEYEMMKMHCDVGASIIESTVGNVNIASYIRYHHERIDGFGYPKGLIGDAIPLGAKILSVSQTFLAKILGRESRAPLSFEHALKTLKSAANSQLDSNVVDALTRWISKKQMNKDIKSTSLGKCYEMRCSPESICSSCNAFNSISGNCWDFGGETCAAHGNHCSTCYIKTEYLMRQDRGI
jgi:HD-GYP domain-containing protein (c-di-GMP phosphodiesterase class II)